MHDGDLVRQTLAGQPRAFEELVQRWTARIVGLCHAKTGRADIADDLAQETLMRAFRGLSSLVAPEKFGSWLCGIAARACLDWLKAKQRTEIPFSILAPKGNPEVFLGDRALTDGQPAEHAEDLRRLMSAVEELPEAYREVLMLYYYDDVTYRDLAEMLGVSSATINARLTKARALLRERLNPSVRG
jgi:RNA polymerase sigma-70 factor (ECF subfamily)